MGSQRLLCLGASVSTLDGTNKMEKGWKILGAGVKSCCSLEEGGGVYLSWLFRCEMIGPWPTAAAPSLTEGLRTPDLGAEKRHNWKPEKLALSPTLSWSARVKPSILTQTTSSKETHDCYHIGRMR